MYAITIVTGGIQWKLVFNEEPKTQLAVLDEFINQQNFHQQLAGQKSVSLSDDFGQNVTVSAGKLDAVLMEDLDLTQEASIRLGLHQARTQQKFQKRANTDSELRAGAKIATGGNIMFDPMSMQRN